MAEGPGKQAMGYILGKAEGKGELWHGHVTAVTVSTVCLWTANFKGQAWAQWYSFSADSPVVPYYFIIAMIYPLPPALSISKCAVCSAQCSCWFIESMHCLLTEQVAPDYRRQRLAHKLMESLEQVTEKVSSGYAALIRHASSALSCTLGSRAPLANQQAQLCREGGRAGTTMESPPVISGCWPCQEMRAHCSSRYESEH